MSCGFFNFKTPKQCFHRLSRPIPRSDRYRPTVYIQSNCRIDRERRRAGQLGPWRAGLERRAVDEDGPILDGDGRTGAAVAASVAADGGVASSSCC